MRRASTARLRLVLDANGSVFNEVNGKLEVSVGKARVLTAKTGQGLENDRARFEAHDTQGTPVEVSLNVSGAQEGFVYRGFWFGEPTGRTFDDSPLGGEDDGR